VAPDVPYESIVSMDEGRTPLLRAEAFGRAIGLPALRIKQCGQSPTGSFKDLGMTVLVSVVAHAAQQGRSIRAVGCASTGDTSAALAAYGAAAGLPVVVLLPRGKVSTAQLVQPIAHGARVLALDTDFDGCMAIVDRLAADGVVYLANSMNALRLEGQKTVAIEICQELGWEPPDWIVLPAGNLGNGYAAYLGFRMLRDLGLVDRLPRLALAQAENANPLYRAFAAGQREVTAIRAAPTVASAIQIGNPVSAPRALAALEAMNGVVEQASEDEIADAAARADRTGLYACPHTAVALAAAEKLARNGVIAGDARVVVVSTASALKFTEFKVRYHEDQLASVVARHRNPPRELAADYDVVRAAIEAP
jgi:threonine synthase